MPDERERCLKAGCDDYIDKLIDHRELLAKVSGYLNGRKTRPIDRV